VYKHPPPHDYLITKAKWCFEQYAHDWFREKGIFKADERTVRHHEGTSFVFKIRWFPGHIVNYLPHLAIWPKMFMAIVVLVSSLKIYKNTIFYIFCIMDRLVALYSVTKIVILFEITLVGKHEIKLYRVVELFKALLASFESVLIVYVIPENLIRNCA